SRHCILTSAMSFLCPLHPWRPGSVCIPSSHPSDVWLSGNTLLHPDVTSCQTDVCPPPVLFSILPARSDVYSFTFFATGLLTLVLSLLRTRAFLRVATYYGRFRLLSRHCEWVRNAPTLP